MNRKKAISAETRRTVAWRAGCRPGQERSARCVYCGARGKVQWFTAWVRFKGLELDHVIPEYLGGDGSPDNIVLACQSCNRSKGWRRTAGEMLA